MTKIKLFLNLTLILIFSYSCANIKESPVIYFSNISSKPIKDLRSIWVENEKLTLPYLGPGDTRSNSFYISSNDDFFGIVKISWRNDEGQKIVREFDFKENNLPGIKNKRGYDYVQIYLDQEDFDIITSDAPNLSYKTTRMDKILAEKKKQFNSTTKTRTPSSLIRIQHNERLIPRRISY